MTEISTNPKTGASSKGHASSPSISPDIPRADGLNIEFPIYFRGLSDNSSAQAKETLGVVKAAADQLCALAESNYAILTKERADYGMKLLETARANTTAVHEFANALAQAKSPPEVIELTTAHARKQMDMIADIHKQLWVAAHKIMTGSMPRATP